MPLFIGCGSRINGPLGLPAWLHTQAILDPLLALLCSAPPSLLILLASCTMATTKRSALSCTKEIVICSCS